MTSTPTTPGAVPVLTEAALAELDAVQKAAIHLSERPWQFRVGSTPISGFITDAANDGKIADNVWVPYGEFIVAAVNALPSLLAEVRALRARCEAAEPVVAAAVSFANGIDGTPDANIVEQVRREDRLVEAVLRYEAALELADATGSEVRDA